MRKKTQKTAMSLVLIALFTALIIVGAFIRIPVPVVPFTLQFLFTSLAGVLLGSRRGALSVLLYLFLGLVGLPVFTQGGGFSYVFQPTFGYLIGFLFGTYFEGLIVERAARPSFLRLIAAGFVNLFFVYAFGLIYCYCISNFVVGNNPVGVWTLVLTGFLLCVPGDIAICFLTAAVARRVIPVVKRSMAYDNGTTRQG